MEKMKDHSVDGFVDTASKANPENTTTATEIRSQSEEERPLSRLRYLVLGLMSVLGAAA